MPRFGLCYFTQPIIVLNANHGMYTKALNKLSKTTLCRLLKRIVPLARVLGCALSVTVLLLGGATSQAITVNGLYDGTVRIKDRADATRTAAFTAAMALVLTKVSGRTDAPAKVGAALSNAARYVQRYSYLSTGQLEVGFDSAAINGLLDQAGLPLWERERPTTLVVYPQALQDVREAKMATEQTAKIRGVPIVWTNSETSDQLPAANLQQLQDLARQHSAAAVLLARAGVGELSAANLRWQMVFNGASQEMTGSAEDGPNLAAEVLGRYYASANKESLHITMNVSGMDNLDAYAGTLSYLNNLLMVRDVAVESLQRDVLRLRLEIRGSQESLRRALAMDQKLIEAPAVATDSSSPATSASTASSTLVMNYRWR